MTPFQQDLIGFGRCSGEDDASSKAAFLLECHLSASEPHPGFPDFSDAMHDLVKGFSEPAGGKCSTPLIEVIDVCGSDPGWGGTLGVGKGNLREDQNAPLSLINFRDRETEKGILPGHHDLL